MFTVAEFKEFDRRFKFKPRFKYGWFHLKLYGMFQDLSRLKFLKFHLWMSKKTESTETNI